MGILSGIIMASIVWVINFDYGYFPATTAAVKQGLYTFLLGGFFIRLLERILVTIKNTFTSILVASLIPTIISVVLVFVVHSFKGTPKPVESTIPTLLLAPPGFFYLAYKKRIKGKFI